MEPAKAEKSENLLNANRPWERWEIGALVTIVDGGGTLDEVAASVGRTSAAVDRAWNRLLSGDMDCPGEYRDALERLRKKFRAEKPGDRAAVGVYIAGLVSGKSKNAALREASVSRTLTVPAREPLMERADTITTMAVAIARGDVSAAGISGLFTPKTFMAIIRLASDLIVQPSASEAEQARANAGDNGGIVNTNDFPIR